MRLEDQVCNSGLARKLKELGVEQESFFVWYTNGDFAHLLDCRDGMRPMEEKSFSAFTVGELGEMLPFSYSSMKCGSLIKQEAWICGLTEKESPDQYGRTEADARAKMLIYLLENRLTKTP